MPKKTSSRFGSKWTDFIPFLALTAMLGAGFYFHTSHLPTFKICWFKRAFDLDCAGCGLSRAFLLIPKGDWVQALKLNGASVLVYGFFFIFWIDQGYRLISGIRSVSSRLRLIYKIVGTAVIVALFANWVGKLGRHFFL